MKMTENEIKWLIWLIFANFVEKWLIPKTWRDCVSEDDIWINKTHHSKKLHEKSRSVCKRFIFELLLAGY